MNKSSIIAAMLTGALFATSAQALVIKFDSLADNSSANLDPAAQASGVSFLSGFLTDDLDEFGDPIPGETHIEAYADSDVRVADPSVYGRGPAGARTVNALFDQLLIRFATPTSITGFGFSEDMSSYGDLFGVDILFLNADGKTLFAVGPYTPNSNPTHRYAFSFAGVTVSQILLSSTSKLYDDITITNAPVPEPASWALMIAGFGLVGAAARRRTFVTCRMSV